LKKLLIPFIVGLMAGACSNPSGADTKSSSASSAADSGMSTPATGLDSGWISLSDGKSLDGWHTYGKKQAGKAWNIDSGAIHLKPGAKNGYQTAGGGDLVSDSTFGNFDLQLEWKIQRKANSGIMVFVQEDTARYRETWSTGPEMQVCDPDSNEDAHSFKHEAGDLYDLIASTIMSARPAGEWNQVEIISNHDSLNLYLNGTHIISTPLWDPQWKKLIAGSKFKTMPGFGTFHSGHIALQDHGEEVWYGHIRVKRL
jgi:hypothetical protein